MNTTIPLRDDNSEKVRYNYTDYPIYISYCMLSWFPSYRFASHWHDDIEFVAVLDGSMDYNVNGEVIHMQKGEGIIVNAKQIHFGYSDCENECELICLLLHPFLLCANAAYEKEFINPIINNNSLAYIKLSSDIPWQKEIYDKIIYIREIRDHKSAPLKVQAAFGHIWSLIFENVSVDKNVRNNNADLTVVKNMVGYINANYGEKISLQDIANAGAVGQSKCCKLFRKYLHITPNHYLLQYRLNQGAVLLQSTDLSVTEIAAEVGFNSSSYFAETFKAFYKSSPSDYKKKHEKTEEMQ